MKFHIILAAAALLLAACAAALAQTLPASVQACVKITQDVARLACLDREIAALSAPKASTLPSTSAKATVTDSSVAPVSAEQKFGLTPGKVEALESKQGTETPKAKKLQAHIARISQAGVGTSLFELDNGQIWRQTQSSSFSAQTGDAVTITPGALGSFWLATNSRNAARVQRVR